MICCYFIARAGTALENLPVELIGHGELVAAVRRLGADARATPERMLEHTALLAAASRRTTILPLRFGTTFRSETAVVHLLAARAGELAAALERLDGKVEMTVRIGLGEKESASRRVREIGELARVIETWSEVQVGRSGERVVEVAHLVPRGQAAEYRKKLADQGLEITGPWPPLHFLPQFLRMPVRAERGRRATASGTSRASGAGTAGDR
jgi:hypothetical protein